jgi:hypothetical protein
MRVILLEILLFTPSFSIRLLKALLTMASIGWAALLHFVRHMEAFSSRFTTSVVKRIPGKDVNGWISD